MTTASLTLTDLVQARRVWTHPDVRAWAGDALDARLAAGLRTQFDWIADAEFGAGFRDGVRSTPEGRHIDADDALLWANRVLDLGGGEWAVTGIRFRGQDVTKPFVDVVATSLPPTPHAINTLVAHLASEYTPFAPQAVRFDVPDVHDLVQDEAVSPVTCAVDMYVVANTVAALRQHERVATFERVKLTPVAPNVAAPQIAALYDELTHERPQLGLWATPIDLDDCTEYADEGLLFAIQVDGNSTDDGSADGAPAGFVAASRDGQHGMAGFEVKEIVLDSAHRGQRLAPAVLQHLCDHLPQDPGLTLWGTIHPDNAPSLRNALSIGRQHVGGFVWVVGEGMSGV